MKSATLHRFVGIGTSVGMGLTCVLLLPVAAWAQSAPPSTPPRAPTTTAPLPQRPAAPVDYTKVTVESIGISAFLQRSGRFSENLVGTKKSLFNSIIGEGDIGEPAEDVLVTVTFGGRADPAGNTIIPQNAATVTITATGPQGRKQLLRQTTGGFLFGPTGRFSRPFLLRNATCTPLTVEVVAGPSRRTATVDFRCGG